MQRPNGLHLKTLESDAESLSVTDWASIWVAICSTLRPGGKCFHSVLWGWKGLVQHFQESSGEEIKPHPFHLEPQRGRRSPDLPLHLRSKERERATHRRAFNCKWPSCPSPTAASPSRLLTLRFPLLPVKPHGFHSQIGQEEAGLKTRPVENQI